MSDPSEVGTRTFVLVHGAYHGGWCWDAVAERLRSVGNAVFAPTLSGVSERRAGPVRDIDLDRHISDVVDLVEARELDAIHLVGWRYGGMVVTGVLARVPQRIRAVTYLDAYLPEHGEAVSRWLSGAERVALSAAAALGIGIPPPDPRKWGVTDEDQLARIRARLSAHPARTLTQPVHARPPWPAHVDYTYVWCRGYAGSVFETFRDKAAADPRFRVVELEASHAAALTHPADVAAALAIVPESAGAGGGA